MDGTDSGNPNNGGGPSIEAIDAQLAASSASIDDILAQEEVTGHSTAPAVGHVPAFLPSSTVGVGSVISQQAGVEDEVTEGFTAQDEQRELSSLTMQELIDIQSDLLGITAGVSNMQIASASSSAVGYNNGSVGGVATTLLRLEEEILALPSRQTEAYRRAQRECPDEVSDRRKMAFVEYSDGSVADAAVRFARYWEERLSLFGPDRAFLPMTLAGAMILAVRRLAEDDMAIKYF